MRVDLPLLVVYHLTTPVRILVGLSKYVPKRLANFPSDYHDSFQKNPNAGAMDAVFECSLRQITILFSAESNLLACHLL